MVEELAEKNICSIHRACKVISLSKAGFYHKPKQRDDEAIISLLNKNVEEHPQEGFWLSYYRFRNQGYSWNHKRVFRVYQSMGLSLRRKKKKRLPDRIKEPLQVPTSINDTWSIDFMSDSLDNKRKFRSFNIMDDYNREAIHVEIDYSFPSRKVVYILNRLTKKRGLPRKIRMDNGPEFMAKILQNWAKVKEIKFHYIQPGKPTQNAFIERLNRTYRENVLNAYIFKNLMEVRAHTQKWIIDYNLYRPHAALGYKSPKQYADIDLLKTFVPQVSNKSTSQNQDHNGIINLEKCLH